MMIKPGVQLRGLSTQVLLAMQAADWLLEGNMVVTSVSEGKHSPGSLHYVGLAFDMRLPGEPHDFVDQLQECLGEEFDVVIERDHIHVEYQPKVQAR